MQSFATCPLPSNALIFPDKYSDRKPNPAKDPAAQCPLDINYVVNLVATMKQ